MGITYAPSGIYLGMALGLLAGVETSNAAVGIGVAIVGSVAGWYGIRAIERLLGRGVNAGVTAISNAMSAKKNHPQVGSPPPGYGWPTQPPSATPSAPPASIPSAYQYNSAGILLPPIGQPNYPPAHAYGYPTYPPAVPQPPAGAAGTTPTAF